MSQLPANLQQYQVTHGKFNEDPGVLKTITGAGYMPYVVLAGGSSKIVKLGKLPVGVYAIMKGKEPVNMGPSFVGWFITWRPRALRIDAKNGNMSYFNRHNPEFQKIVDVANSGVKLSGCMYGPEILLWIPEHQMFTTMFWSNPTMRNEYANLHPMLGAWVTFGIRVIDDGKNVWHGPQVAICQTPPSNVPDADDFNITLNKFNNPPETEIEKVEDAPGGDERPQ